MKKKRKDVYRKMSYEQQKAQQSLDVWVPEPVVSWEEKLKDRPSPGTKAYREWWSELTRKEQEKALEIRRQENAKKNQGLERSDSGVREDRKEDERDAGRDRLHTA